MNAHERRQLTAEVAERLLNGHPDVPRHARRLADRLATASAPAFPGELAGEDAAAAAFTAAVGTGLAPQPGRSSMMKSAVVAKLLTLKVAAVAVAAVSLGGVALAASTGVLPNPLAPSNPGHSTPATRPDATPSPSMIGLCTAYLAGAGADHGKALESPAFSALITAAGGKDHVNAFCTALGVTTPGSGRGAGNPSGPPTTHPGPTDHPTGMPTAHPDSTDHPTGQPSHPTDTPTSHPGA